MKKRNLIYHIAFFLIFCMPLSCFAENKSFHMAMGGGLSFYNLQDYGESTFTPIAPEFVTYGYLNIFSKFWFRPGLRLNGTWQQPDMPQALRIEETNLIGMVDAGIVFDWIIVPSFSCGIGKIFRISKFKTQAPIAPGVDNISGTELIPMYQFQIGLGFPILKGLILFEPYGRYTIVQNDQRYGWGYGFEMTFQIF